MSSHTMEEIAASYALWMDYFDTSGIDSREEFEARPMAERLEMIADCGFAPENCEGCNAPMNNAEEGLCPECAADRSATDE